MALRALSSTPSPPLDRSPCSIFSVRCIYNNMHLTDFITLYIQVYTMLSLFMLCYTPISLYILCYTTDILVYVFEVCLSWYILCYTIILWDQACLSNSCP